MHLSTSQFFRFAGYLKWATSDFHFWNGFHFYGDFFQRKKFQNLFWCEVGGLQKMCWPLCRVYYPFWRGAGLSVIDRQSPILSYLHDECDLNWLIIYPWKWLVVDLMNQFNGCDEFNDFFERDDLKWHTVNLWNWSVADLMNQFLERILQK